MKRALITGIAGQDGSYLAEYLLTKGYKVFGLVRSELTAAQNLKNVMDKVQLFYGDLTDQLSLLAAIKKSEPDELYNLAGQPFVPNSWLSPQETINVNVGGLARLLDIVERTDRRIRVYQASSSEMFGNHRGASNEETPLVPTSPYGVSKLAAHHLCRVYRDKGVFAVGGILFNHESPRRGPEMVTRRSPSMWPPGCLAALSLCVWAGSTLRATGALPETTWKRCTSCCNRTSLGNT